MIQASIILKKNYRYPQPFIIGGATCSKRFIDFFGRVGSCHCQDDRQCEEGLMRRGACKLQLLCYMYELEAAERVVHWLNKSVVHFVESIKEIIDEKFGNEIMSAIDFYCSVD